MQSKYVSALAIASLSLLVVTRSQAATFGEDFSTDPTARGWQKFGNAGLFSWDAVNQNLQVTWDSSQTNSYFYRPLGTVLARDDDFSAAFDLRLADAATGPLGNKTGPFQLALGFLNLADATAPEFRRATMTGARNVAEFDYFPAGYYAEYGAVDPTVSPTIISSTNGFASGFTYPREFAPGALYHVLLSYTAADQTLRTTITSNGVPVAPIQDVVLDASFGDFRLDAFSISSYSDAGDDFDSVLAHGTVDNLLITVPPPPVTALTSKFTSGAGLVQFASGTNWDYTLERTTDFQSWSTVSPVTTGNGGAMTLQDPQPPQGRAFYRVRAGRP